MSSVEHNQPDIVTSSDLYSKRLASESGQWFLDGQTRAILKYLAVWPKALVP